MNLCLLGNCSIFLDNGFLVVRQLTFNEGKRKCARRVQTVGGNGVMQLKATPKVKHRQRKSAWKADNRRERTLSPIYMMNNSVQPRKRKWAVERNRNEQEHAARTVIIIVAL